MTFISLSVFLWNDLADPLFGGVGLAGHKSMANTFFIGLGCSPLLSSTIFPFLFFLSILVLWVKSFMARSIPVENLQSQNVGSIINYLQQCY